MRIIWKKGALGFKDQLHMETLNYQLKGMNVDQEEAEGLAPAKELKEVTLWSLYRRENNDQFKWLADYHDDAFHIAFEMFYELLVRKVSEHFNELIKKELGTSRFKKMIQDNRGPDYQNGSCATHNYCDANLVMESAFTKEFNREPIILWGEGDLDLETNLWNRAWEYSLHTEFGTKS